MIVGYAYVVADLFHIGHLKHLRACKALCDKLVVGVLTNAATMEKKQAPIISYEERLEIIEALGCVDVAVRQDTYSPLPNAVSLCVDVLFESTSHTKEAIEEANSVMACHGGMVRVMPYYSEQSSTAIKNKIIEEWKVK